MNATRVLDFTQVSDSYLLAWLVRTTGELASFDQRLVTDAVVEGRQALHLIR